MKGDRSRARWARGVREDVAGADCVGVSGNARGGGMGASGAWPVDCAGASVT